MTLQVFFSQQFLEVNPGCRPHIPRLMYFMEELVSFAPVDVYTSVSCVLTLSLPPSLSPSLPPSFLFFSLSLSFSEQGADGGGGTTC